MSEDFKDEPPQDTVHEIIKKEAEADQLREQLEGETRTCEHCGKPDIPSNMSQLKDGTWLCHPCDAKAREEEERARKEQAVRGSMTFNDSKHVKALLKAVTTLTDSETTWTLDKDGLHLVQMDPSRVSETIVNYPKHAFDEFSCRVPGKFAFDAQFVLDRRLKNIYANETVELTVGYETAALMLHGQINRKSPLTLVDPSSEESPPIPKVEHTVNARLVVETLRNVIRDMQDGNAVAISADNDSITFTELEDGQEGYHVTLQQGDAGLLVLERKLGKRAPPEKAKYNVAYLRAFLENVYPLAEVVALTYACDRPAKFEVLLGRNDATLVYWIAPRVETD